MADASSDYLPRVCVWCADPATVLAYTANGDKQPSCGLHGGAPRTPIGHPDALAELTRVSQVVGLYELPPLDSRVRAAVEFYVRDVLAVTYTVEGVDIWLSAPNRHLGGRTPLAALERGVYGPVIEAAEQIESGL